MSAPVRIRRRRWAAAAALLLGLEALAGCAGQVERSRPGAAAAEVRAPSPGEVELAPPGAEAAEARAPMPGEVALLPPGAEAAEARAPSHGEVALLPPGAEAEVALLPPEAKAAEVRAPSPGEVELLAPGAEAAEARALSPGEVELVPPGAKAAEARAPSPGKVEFLPPGAKAADALPTVIALHGRGGDAERFASLVSRRLAPGARVVALQAPARYQGGYSWFEVLLATEDHPRLAQAIEEQSEEVLARLEAWLDDHPTCGRPIVVGFSQGGALALALAAAGTERVAAVIDLSGALPPRYPIREGASDQAPRVRSVHGKRDPLVPIALTRRTAVRLRAKGRSVVLRETSGTHDPDRAMVRAARRLVDAELARECPPR